MPQHKSAAKRVRSNEKRRVRNRLRTVRVRTLIKDLQETTDPALAQEKLSEVKAALDRMAIRRIFHPNKAANLKSQLERHVRSLG